MAEFYSVQFGNLYDVVFGNYYPPGGGPPPPSFAIDGTSGKPVPNDATEWSNFLTSIGSAIPVPSHLWLVQEGSGSPADSIGAKPLTAASVSYGKVIPGWSRTAIGGSGVAVAGSIRNITMVDTSANSYLVFGFSRYDTPSAALKAFYTYGSVGIQLPALTNKIRLREGAGLVDSTNNHNTTVHPFVLAFNIAASTVKAYTDLEKLSIAFLPSVGSICTFTASTTGDTLSNDFLYLAAWDGVAGETTDAEVKNLISGFGFTPPWS